MDCLRSAKFQIGFLESFVFGSQSFNLKINPQGVSVQVNLNSKWEIEGFKNIDVYGIKFIQKTFLQDNNYYSTGIADTIIWENKYDISLTLDGTIEILNGKNVLPGFTSQSTTEFLLNNYTSELMLASPILSCKSLTFGNFQTTYGLTYANSTAAAGHNFLIGIQGDLYLYYRYQED